MKHTPITSETLDEWRDMAQECEPVFGGAFLSLIDAHRDLLARHGWVEKDSKEAWKIAQERGDELAMIYTVRAIASDAETTKLSRITAENEALRRVILIMEEADAILAAPIPSEAVKAKRGALAKELAEKKEKAGL